MEIGVEINAEKTKYVFTFLENHNVKIGNKPFENWHTQTFVSKPNRSNCIHKETKRRNSRNVTFQSRSSVFPFAT
jgi:hypothetical protein